MFAPAALVTLFCAAPWQIVAPVSPSPVAQILPSGVRLLVSPHSDSTLVAVEIRVRGTGSASETPAENGISHAVEHMVFKGTADVPPGGFDRQFESMGGEAGAQTGRDATVYRVCVPPERWRDALVLLAAMLRRPAFRADDWACERQVIQSEMRVAQSDTARAGLQHLVAASGADGDPYRQPLMGTPGNVARFGVDDLRTFHAAHYALGNVSVSVAGAVTADEARAAAEAAFPPVAGGAAAVPPPLPIPAATIPDGVVRAPLPPASEQTESRLATVYLGFHAPRLQTDPHGAAACDVLAAFLARGGKGGVLGRRLFADKTGGALSVRAEYLPNARGALFVVSATGERHDIGRIEDALVGSLEDLAARVASGDDKSGALANDLAAARATVTGAARYERATAAGDAEALARGDMLGTPLEYASAADTVTLADLLRLLTNYVVPGKRTVAVVGVPAAPPADAAKGENAP